MPSLQGNDPGSRAEVGRLSASRARPRSAGRMTGGAPSERGFPHGRGGPHVGDGVVAAPRSAHDIGDLSEALIAVADEVELPGVDSAIAGIPGRTTPAAPRWGAAWPRLPALPSAPQYRPANNTSPPACRLSRARLESNVAGSPSTSTRVMAQPLLFAALPEVSPSRALPQPATVSAQVISVLRVIAIAPGSFAPKRAPSGRARPARATAPAPGGVRSRRRGRGTGLPGALRGLATSVAELIRTVSTGADDAAQAASITATSGDMSQIAGVARCDCPSRLGSACGPGGAQPSTAPCGVSPGAGDLDRCA